MGARLDLGLARPVGGPGLFPPVPQLPHLGDGDTTPVFPGQALHGGQPLTTCPRQPRARQGPTPSPLTALSFPILRVWLLILMLAPSQAPP